MSASCVGFFVRHLPYKFPLQFFFWTFNCTDLLFHKPIFLWKYIAQGVPQDLSVQRVCFWMHLLSGSSLKSLSLSLVQTPCCENTSFLWEFPGGILSEVRSLLAQIMLTLLKLLLCPIVVQASSLKYTSFLYLSQSLPSQLCFRMQFLWVSLLLILYTCLGWQPLLKLWICIAVLQTLSESTSFKVLPAQNSCLNTPSCFNTPLKVLFHHYAKHFFDATSCKNLSQNLIVQQTLSSQISLAGFFCKAPSPAHTFFWNRPLLKQCLI